MKKLYFNIFLIVVFIFSNKSALSYEISRDVSINVRSAIVKIMVGDGYGTGFVISPDGVVITAAHVIRPSDNITVKLPNGREYNAEILGYASNGHDIGALKIDVDEPLSYMKMANDSMIYPGKTVYAFGKQYPGFNGFLSKGIVSDFIPKKGVIIATPQINSGASGSPLFDVHGSVLGVVAFVVHAEHTDIYDTEHEYLSGFSGAISVSEIKKFVAELRDGVINKTPAAVFLNMTFPLSVIEINKEIYGRVDENSDTDWLLEYSDGYIIDLKKGDIIRVKLSSNDFEPAIVMYDHHNNIISRVNFDHDDNVIDAVYLVNESGRYTFVVGSLDVNVDGAYKLIVRKLIDDNQ